MHAGTQSCANCASLAHDLGIVNERHDTILEAMTKMEHDTIVSTELANQREQHFFTIRSKYEVVVLKLQGEYELLYQRQDYGALLLLLIFSNLEGGHDVLVISLDVAGAFDRLWHDGPIKKWIAARLHGLALRLVKDYLRRRFIQVLVEAGASKSEMRRIFSSAPQGGK